MWKSFVKSSFRVLVRHRSFSMVNTFGLALGLSVFIALALYIQSELSFDSFHKNAHRIYRIEQFMDGGGREERMTGTPEPLWRVLKKDFPEVEASMRLVEQELKLVPEEGEPFVANAFFMENSFLTSFSFELIHGDPVHALEAPYSLVLTETTARKLFGRTDVVGESYDLGTNVFDITGVLEDVPANSHLDFDLLVSVETISSNAGGEDQAFGSWGNNWVRLYVMLKEGHDIEDFNRKILHYLKVYQGEDSSNELYARPLLDIHLHSNLADDYAVLGSMRNIYILITMAIFVLIMAGINFTNLAIAYTTVRAGEVCLRKMNGAGKRILLTQYLSESLFMTLVALIVGFVLFETYLPLFNKLVGRQLDFQYLANYRLLMMIIATGLFTGLLSGAYPAWLISRSQPNAFLKSQMSKGNKNPMLRKVLIGIQFFASTTLIIGMLIMLRQTNYMMHKDLGFNPEGVIRIEFADSSMVRIERLQEILSAHPDITGSTVHDYPVCESNNWTTITWEGAREDEAIRMNVNYADPYYLDVYQMRLVAGDGFRAKQQGTGPEGNLVILNQAAIDLIQMDDPIGKEILYGLDYKGILSGNQATIVGIIEDFHFLSVHNVIRPFMLRLYNEEQTGWSISVRYDTKDIAGIRDYIREEFLAVFPGQAFDYEWVDEFHNQMYKEEKKMTRIILYIAILANIIAALGLYGLIAYSTSIRTREVGLRKVLGASFFTISRLFSREYILLVIIANLAAWPAVYFATQRWLQSFPYRVNPSIWPYVAAIFLTLAIAYGSMLYHTFKASRINPADSLRYE
ncbi:MAG: ABC transporter permease [Bacteroidota bacterium]